MVVVVASPSPSARACALIQLSHVWHPQLPHGWHTICAVGCAGRTTFYVDGRQSGSIMAQVTANMAQFGNCTLSSGCGGPAGAIYDLRVYGGALSKAAVRELDGTASVGSGGLGAEEVGVWATEAVGWSREAIQGKRLGLRP